VQKRAAEDVLAQAWEGAGFPATRLRIPMVNGERDNFRRIESYLWRILDGGPVLLPDGGAQPCRHVSGADVARAAAELLGRPATFGQAYNLSQEKEPTLAELVGQLAEVRWRPGSAGGGRLGPAGGARAEAVAHLAVQRPVDVAPGRRAGAAGAGLPPDAGGGVPGADCKTTGPNRSR
jgi:uncharacterized protein YbjT (DUF2867 family)